MNDRCDVVYVSVEDDGEECLLTAPTGATLRDVLVDAGKSPYTRLTERLNCGGRGLCATCGVRIDESTEPEPTHWHDDVASRWGYPRLCCQIRLESDLRVRIPQKVIWGRRTGADSGP
jgi:ferredoxin